MDKIFLTEEERNLWHQKSIIISAIIKPEDTQDYVHLVDEQLDNLSVELIKRLALAVRQRG